MRLGSIITTVALAATVAACSGEWTAPAVTSPSSALTLRSPNAQQYPLPDFVSSPVATRTLTKGSFATGSCQFNIPVAWMVIEADWTTCDAVLGFSPSWGRETAAYFRRRLGAQQSSSATAPTLAAMIACIDGPSAWGRFSEGYYIISQVVGGVSTAVAGLQNHAVTKIKDPAQTGATEWCVFSQSSIPGCCTTNAQGWGNFPWQLLSDGHKWVGATSNSTPGGNITHGAWAQYQVNCPGGGVVGFNLGTSSDPTRLYVYNANIATPPSLEYAIMQPYEPSTFTLCGGVQHMMYVSPGEGDWYP